MDEQKKLRTISQIVVKPGISYSFDEFTQSPVVIPFKYKGLIMDEIKQWIKNIDSGNDENLNGLSSDERKGAKKILMTFFEIKPEDIK